MLLASILVASCLLPTAAIAGNGEHKGEAVQGSACNHAIRPYGAAVQVRATAAAWWHTPQHAFANGNNSTEVHDCGPPGRLEVGGTLHLSVTVAFNGQNLESCSVGFPNIINCQISAGKTLAMFTYEEGPFENTNGKASFDVGNIDVHAGNRGYISSITIRSSAKWVYGTDSRVAVATVALKY